MAMPQPAKILSQRSYLVPGKMRITEWFFQVPVNYHNPSTGTLHLFARSAARHTLSANPDEDKASAGNLFFAGRKLKHLHSPHGCSGSKEECTPKKDIRSSTNDPQGPGCSSPSPQTYPLTSTLIDKGYQMLYLDQRGTGLSSPISASTLALKGDDHAQAAYLRHFRADSIVRDAEAIRLALTQHEADERKRRWALFGQSFGGFCAVTYLSLFPASLREVFLTGGSPPLVDRPDEVYRRTFKKVVERNQAYYEKYPEDVDRVKQVLRFLKSTKVQCPSGGVLTPRRFLQLGIDLGRHGGVDTIHETVLQCWSELQSVGLLTRQTLSMIEAKLGFDDRPLYAILHEAIYCEEKASSWSAERVMREKYRGFDPDNTLDMKEQPTYFTGEMIFPFMFEDTYPELAKMKGAANVLAADTAWPALYDRKQLARNTVPVYAAIYLDDMYVDSELSLATASAIKGCKTFVTNTMYHSAISSKTEQLIDELWKLRCDTLD